MHIYHQVSKIYKIINFDAQVIEQVDIRVDRKLFYSLNKSRGFYILYDLLEGKHTITISHKKYKTVEFVIDISNDKEILPEIVYLQWKDNYLPSSKKIVTGKLESNQKGLEYYYCVCTKKTMFKVLTDLSQGTQILKIKFSENIPLDYQMVAISSCSTIYQLKEYDFEKKGYVLDCPLEAEIELGDSIYLLQKGILEENGMYRILVDTNFCDKEKNIPVLFIYDKKQQKVVVNCEISES